MTSAFVGFRGLFTSCLLVGFILTGLQAQPLGPAPQKEPLDLDKPIPRYEPLPDGETLMRDVRARLPVEVLNIRALIKSRDGQGRKKRYLGETQLDFGGLPPKASYTLLDSFGTPLEKLDIAWPAPGEARYAHYMGAELNSVDATAFDPFQLAAGLDFAWADLSLAFLWWEGAEAVGRETRKTRKCWIVDIPPPPAYRKRFRGVRLWVDRKESLVMMAEVYDAAGIKLRSIEVESIKKINEVWMVKDLEIKTHASRTKTHIIVQDLQVADGERIILNAPEPASAPEREAPSVSPLAP